MNKSYIEWIDYYENATKEDVIQDMMLDINNIKEKDKEIERLTAESTEWESKCYKYQDIINELEKDMREKYHKEIDYQSKIMQSDLMQGDYPVSYYYAEQNEKLLNYYLNKLKALKEGK